MDNDNTAAGGETKKAFVKRDIRGYIIFFAVMIFVAAVVVCVLMLLPGRNPSLRAGSESGLGRSFVFPFVFADEKSSLYVIKNQNEAALPVDDSVRDALHIASKGVVYYVRENTLYCYEIDAGRRYSVAVNVDRYAVAGDRASVYYSAPDGSFWYSNGKTSTRLDDAGEGRNGAFFTVGVSAVLFVSNIDAAAGTADLCCFAPGGTVKKLLSGISAVDSFGLSGGDKYAFCRKDGELCVFDIKGNEIARTAGAAPVEATKQAALYEPSTKVLTLDGNAALNYSYAPAAEGAQFGSVLYFDGKTFKTLADSVSRIIYCAADHSLLLYTVPENGGERVYRANGKGSSEKLVLLEENVRCLYDTDSDYLYFQNKAGALYRVKIYSSKLDTVQISESSSLLYKYPGKPFVQFTIEDSDVVSLVHSSNMVQQYNGSEEKRLYGADDEKYLLLRVYGDNKLSLDRADSGYFTRISADVDNSVFFDGLLNTVIYSSGGSLWLWTEKGTAELGRFGRITAVNVA
ncbi:MAG: hypothetical protein J6V14_06600 [Clostridia bacterium]|nr:hypothetical protein [Clostridia bacterium]